jgi:hypothetical protein
MSRSPPRRQAARAATAHRSGRHAWTLVVGCYLAGCSPSAEVLSRTGDSGGGSAVGTAGPSVGGMSVGGMSVGGTGGEPATPLACSTHRDCVAGDWCQNSICTACSSVTQRCPLSCAAGFAPTAVLRNGCMGCECAPPSTCFADSDCAPGQVCYPGRQCAESCGGPTCCAGNFCASPGCPSTSVLSCGLVGCEGGGSCSFSCAPTGCTCDGQNWHCSDGSTPGNPSGGMDPCAAACLSP